VIRRPDGWIRPSPLPCSSASPIDPRRITFPPFRTRRASEWNAHSTASPLIANGAGAALAVAAASPPFKVPAPYAAVRHAPMERRAADLLFDRGEFIEGAQKALAVEVDHVSRILGDPDFGLPCDIGEVPGERSPIRKGSDEDESGTTFRE
jgi:hypothetical protein